MILLLDNYDSFTFNLYQALAALGATVEVVRNDEIAVDEVDTRLGEIDGIVVSPGPATPAEAGISVDLVRRLASRVPMLGVSLGQHVIGQAFGADVVPAPELAHGKASTIHHDGRTIFGGLPNPFAATRYHSFIIDADAIPLDFEITARSADGIVQGIRHKEMPIEGVLFHPESIMTAAGSDLLRNFLAMCDRTGIRTEIRVPVLGY